MIAAAARGHAPGGAVAPPFDLRDVALPTTAADVTKQLSDARHRPPRPGRPLGRHARAQRPGGARPRGHRGRGGRSRRPGAGGPARRRLGGEEAQQRAGPARSWATRSRRPCARCCRSASTAPGWTWTRRWPPTCSTPRPASTSCRSPRADGAAQPRHRRARRDGAGPGPGRPPARRPTSPAWRWASASASTTEDMARPPRRHRDAARAGAGQNGGGRHRRRPGRAAGDHRRAEGVRGRAPGARCRSTPATSST